MAKVTETAARRVGVLGLLAVGCAAAVMMATPTPTQAAGASREARLFDRPSAVKTLPPTSSDDPVGEITCTYYAALMVRETGTDTPDPGAATVLRYSGARPTCGRTASPNAVTMKTDGYSLLGQKGPYLVFDATDPNGAVDFLVIDPGTGKTLFEDGKSESGLTSVSLQGGVLRLRYTRGLNASCSIVQGGAACWAKLAHDGSIPATLGKTAPPVQTCKAAYRKTPADDPSIILYLVETTIDGAGKSQATVRGPIRCEPMP
ncbi:MAG TPA: hypothetical protein VN806_16015 [Caulobacteraceae bacterium]|nr:hypothetical protein [Caulobacteraceae bacterium]